MEGEWSYGDSCELPTAGCDHHGNSQHCSGTSLITLENGPRWVQRVAMALLLRCQGGGGRAGGQPAV